MSDQHCFYVAVIGWLTVWVSGRFSSIFVHTSCLFPLASWMMAATIVRLFETYVVAVVLRPGIAMVTMITAVTRYANIGIVAITTPVRTRSGRKRSGLMR